MGVSGAGKTTAGQALAAALGWTFYDADDFHSPANIEKMRTGHALTDADRLPWLERLRALIGGAIANGDHIVLACSALKKSYRAALVAPQAHPGAVRFVFLDVPRTVLHDRLATRKHYFAPSLLDSQLETLERPRDAIIVDGTRPVPEIVRDVRSALPA